jgi:rRNA pseudouridine-1189 N-methylase Emg1 (Nep1/Mra1 family)
MDNPETQAILGTRQRRKTNKKKNGQPKDTGILSTRHRTKTNKKRNGQHRDRGNIRHKTQDEDK